METKNTKRVVSYIWENELSEKNEKTLIMGILNITPDSFYDGGKYSTIETALKHAEEMVKDGADIIDVGGESTRPYSDPVTPDEEKKRIIPVISLLAKKFSIPISVDTYKSEVAKEALNSGASMVNDISGLRFDKNMAKLVAERDVPIIIMHIKGTPKNMQDAPQYENVVQEIKDYFKERIQFATTSGIKRNKIFIDPGIGFGKTTKHNIEILRNISEFKSLGQPIAIGTSRKSFIGRILGSEENPIPAEDRLAGSIATYVWLILQSVKILRVHDVKETKQVLKVIQEIKC